MMSAPVNPADPPMAEPGKRPTGGDVGGVAGAAQAGVADWAQRSTERGEQAATGRARTGDGAGAAADPRIDLGGKSAPGSAPGASAHTDRPASDDRATPAPDAMRDSRSGAPRNAPSADRQRDDDDDEWRHEPVAPVDEPNPLRSLGKAVGDTVTGSGPETPSPPER